jgi:hypothetical protein
VLITATYYATVGGRSADNAVAEVPAARECGPVDLDEHLLVVLLQLGRPCERPVRLRGAVGRAGAVADGGGRGQPQHRRDVRVAEPHHPPPRRQRAEDATPEACAAHAPAVAAAAAASLLLLLLLLRGADAAAELRDGEGRARLRGVGVKAVVAPVLPVGLDAALVCAVHGSVELERGRSLRRSSGSNAGSVLW